MTSQVTLIPSNQDQNIELIVLIIENSGKYLLRTKASHKRFKFELDKLIKLMGSKPLTP
jgi:hypothetical protein